MPRIILGMIICTLCVTSLGAQQVPNDNIGSPSQPPSLEGGMTVVPRSDSAVPRQLPNPADAWWKLGRMYADRGDHARAFGIYRQLVDSYRDGSGWIDAAIAADSHVALGVYYLNGIPGTLPADPDAAYGLLEYAATYFRDRDAQYELGRMLLSGKRKNVVQAARWLNAAASKNHRPAQAELGSLLLKGEGIPRQPGRGLFWLMLANDGDDAPDWIKERYASALAQATDDDRRLAYQHLEAWLKK
jgi:tetratricopeptide (TPR) repeat protein